MVVGHVRPIDKARNSPTVTPSDEAKSDIILRIDIPPLSRRSLAVAVRTRTFGVQSGANVT